MHNEFTAIIERDGKWHIAYCPEVPGANGQGESREEAISNLRDAIAAGFWKIVAKTVFVGCQPTRTAALW